MPRCAGGYNDPPVISGGEPAQGLAKSAFGFQRRLEAARSLALAMSQPPAWGFGRVATTRTSIYLQSMQYNL
jgi:hypothetical protein